MGQRLKGQEVEVVLLVDGAPKTTITAVKSFEVTFALDIKKEGYLGEKASRRDEVYDGVTGKMELHLENPDVLDVVNAIIDRAKRRTPGTKINIKSTLNWPDGSRKVLTIIDASFGAVPLNFASRTDYGTISLTFESDKHSLR